MISRIASFVLLSLLIVSSAFAQGDIGPMQLDPYFGVNGVRTVTFPGTTNDSVTCGIVFSRPSPDHQGIPIRSPIIIGGRLLTSNPGEVRFGVVRMDSGGAFAKNFGTNGLVNLSWSPTAEVDYPNAILMMRDSSLFFSGASSETTHSIGTQPTLFKLKGDGSPDSTFGQNGRAIAPAAIQSVGVFTTIDTTFDAIAGETRVIGMGYCDSFGTGGLSGFYAARYTLAGDPDPLFGAQGMRVIPLNLRSGYGFQTWDHRILFVGTDTSAHPEIVVARLSRDGSIDLTYGINGVCHTGIHLNGTDKTIHPVYSTANDTALYIVARFEDSASFTIVRFERDSAAISRKFGVGGFASLNAQAHLWPQGVTISNDGSLLVAGVTDTGAGHPMAGKYLNIGRFDETFGNDGYFGTAGTQMLDVGSNAPATFQIFNSYSVRSNPRLIGVGTMRAGGHQQFVIARYTRVPPPKQDPDTLDFGAVDTGTTKTMTITLTDTTTTQNIIRMISLQAIPSSFRIVSPLPPIEIAPGQSRVITIAFTPDTIRTYRDSLFLFRPGVLLQQVAIRGVGRAPNSDVALTPNHEVLIAVHPNPASNSVTISSNDGIRSLAMLDELGRCVRNIPSAVTNELQLHISDLPDGVYYCLVQTNSGSFRTRLDIVR